jgi:hypothetical protein
VHRIYSFICLVCFEGSFISGLIFSHLILGPKFCIYANKLFSIFVVLDAYLDEGPSHYLNIATIFATFNLLRPDTI